MRSEGSMGIGLLECLRMLKLSQCIPSTLISTDVARTRSALTFMRITSSTVIPGSIIFTLCFVFIVFSGLVFGLRPSFRNMNDIRVSFASIILSSGAMNFTLAESYYSEGGGDYDVTLGGGVT